MSVQKNTIVVAKAARLKAFGRPLRMKGSWLLLKNNSNHQSRLTAVISVLHSRIYFIITCWKGKGT